MKKRAYLRDPTVPMPQAVESPKDSGIKRRRLYLKDPGCSVPRQTTWCRKKLEQDIGQSSCAADPSHAVDPADESSHAVDPADESSHAIDYGDQSYLSETPECSEEEANSTSDDDSVASLSSDQLDATVNESDSSSSCDDPPQLSMPSDELDSTGNNSTLSQATPSSLSNAPLYNGAPITCKESWTSIYKFAVSNKLSDSSTQQLLDLIASHCPTPNSCPRTVFKLKKQVKLTEVSYFYYCSICMSSLSPEKRECRRCRGESFEVCYFALMPFEEHLKEIFSENWDKVQYPFVRLQSPGMLSDIQDGERYRRQAGPGKFFSVPEHAGLILCADGVPLFKSSSQSLWPIQLCITNLPPEVRMDLRYMLLAGVWLGPMKPTISIILKPILEKIHAIYSDGIAISTSSGCKRLRAKLLCCVFDLPARAMALNMMQWNGRYGCTHCLDEGTQVSHVRIYLPDDQHTARLEKDTMKYALEASPSAPVFGVKGPSVLSPYINIVKDTVIDYMHSVLEGVAKTILHKFWLNGAYKDHRFYLHRDIKQIDKILLCIRPPHEFRRTPRSIERTVKYWKASELRAWLLFYVIPILFDFLPSDYLHHLNLLVRSLHLLLSTKLSHTNLLAAEKMLTIFYNTSVDLYPREICTMNVHSLVHLVQTVRNFGPLWCYSCFGFESMNGHLKKHCHGTRNVLPQLVHNLRFHQSILDQEYNSGDHEDGVRGKIKQKKLCSSFIQALNEANYNVSSSTFAVFPRYKHKGILYEVCKDSKLRNSSVCKFAMANRQASSGSIQLLCYCDKIPVAIMSVYGCLQDAFEDVHPASIPELNSLSLSHSCVFKVKKPSPSDKLLAVPVTSIIFKYAHVFIDTKPYDFIVPLPNPYEHH